MLKQPECSFALQHWQTQLKILLQHMGSKRLTQDYYFMLGAEAAGKSSLLAHKFNFPLQSLNSDDHDALIHYNPRKLLFNIPGTYLQDNFRSLWPALTRLLKQTCTAKAPAGIFIVVNVRQWLTQSVEEQQRFTESVTDGLVKITATTKQRIPLTLLLTHTDQLQGFSECFQSLTAPARQQPLGLLLDLPVGDSDLKTSFEQGYQQLLQRIQRFTLPRVQQERILAKQIYIKHFPRQIDALKAPIFNLLHQLDQGLPPQMHWQWLGFTSNEQTAASIDLLAPALQPMFPTATPQTTLLADTHHAYFSADILAQALKPTSTNSKPLSKTRISLRYVSYASAAVLTLGGTFGLANYFGQQMQGLNQADAALQQFRFRATSLTSNTTLSTIIPALQNLEHAVAALKSIQPRSQLTKDSQQLLRLNLQNQFLPRIARVLETALNQQKKQPGNKLYNLLKAYLMLGEPQYLNADFLGDILNRYLPQVEKQRSAAVLSQVLSNALQQAQPIPLNTSLIQEVRDTLVSLPQPLLAYLNVKNATASQVVQPDLKNTIFEFPVDNFAIPRLYTQTAFKAIYEQKINAASDATLKNDWVLGTTQVSVDNQQLMQQVQSLYLADYVNWWNLSLFKTKLRPIANLKQAEVLAKILSSKDSPLQAVLTVIKDNTQPLTGKSPALRAFNQTVAARFSAINATQLTEVSDNLNNLARLLHDINNNKNSTHMAFLVAKDFFANPKRQNPIQILLTQAQQLPEPLKGWFTQIAQSSWQLILQAAQNEIEYAWQKQVLPFYQKSIADRYPLNKKATTDISLDDFNAFFGYNGKLETFFNNYLADFVAIDASKWSLKTRYHTSLSLNPETLQQFERAHVIRTMFFPNKTADIAIAFELKPLLFEPIVKTVALTMNQQHLKNRQGSSKATRFVWPGKGSNNQTQLEFTNIDGKYSATEENGPWSLFRLLDVSNLEQVGDSRHYQVIFDLNGSAVKYALVASNTVNPFMPNIIEHFKAPKVVTGGG